MDEIRGGMVFPGEYVHLKCMQIAIPSDTCAGLITHGCTPSEMGNYTVIIKILHCYNKDITLL